MQNPDKGSTPTDNPTNPLGTRYSTEQNLSAIGAEGKHNGISSDSRTEAQTGKKKKQSHAPKKTAKRDDSQEQLSNARSVIYSLKKKIEDFESSNRLLSEELTLLRRLQPSTNQSNHLHQDQDQDSLLVKRRNDNHSPGPVIRELVPSSHQRSELSNTILCIFSG